MKVFSEWLKSEDINLYIALNNEGLLSYLGKKARNVGTALAIGTAGMGGVDNVAQYSGHSLPPVKAAADQLGDYGEYLNNRKRRKFEKKRRGSLKLRN